MKLSNQFLESKIKSIVSKVQAINMFEKWEYFFFLTNIDEPHELLGEYIDSIGCFEELYQVEEVGMRLRSHMNCQVEGGLNPKLLVNVWIGVHKKYRELSETELQIQIEKINKQYEEFDKVKEYRLLLSNEFNLPENLALKNLAALGCFKINNNLEKVLNEIRKSGAHFDFVSNIKINEEVFVHIKEINS